MDRQDWLTQMRREAEWRYDVLWAPQYGKEVGVYPNAMHLRFIRIFLSLVPQPSALLDAACGAGRYLGLLLEPGHTVTGIDQSEGMLARARDLFPAAHLEKIGLQEIAQQQAFDGIICMDALENVPPEDWPLVLGNFQRALTDGGHVYFTVELADAGEIAEAVARGQAMGLPVVAGEWADGDVYRFYPSQVQVREWLGQAGLKVVEEGEGDDYRHVLARKA